MIPQSGYLYFLMKILTDMRVYKFLFAVLLLCMATGAESFAQDGAKKALTQEEIVGKLPSGILNPMPIVAGWVDANNLKLAYLEASGYNMYSYDLKTGVKTPVENAPKQIVAVPEAMKKFQSEPIAKKVKNPTLSPCGTKVAFTDADNNLCVWNSADSQV